LRKRWWWKWLEEIEQDQKAGGLDPGEAGGEVAVLAVEEVVLD
jgi:hypothetical protein